MVMVTMLAGVAWVVLHIGMLRKLIGSGASGFHIDAKTELSRAVRAVIM
jgi:hypothetical protein